MTNRTIFKRIFEVHVLHEYYLDNWYWSNNEPLSFFKYPSDIERNFILENKYNILQDLHIEPTPETLKLINGLKMKWRVTPLGWVVGMEVEKKETNGAIKFYPKISIPADTDWEFIISTRNPYFFNITNHALRPTIPGYYYFTNLNADEDGKVFPSLAVQLPEFSNQRTWEMGELIRVGNMVKAADNTTKAFNDFTKIAQIDPNPALNTWYHWAQTADRVAIPKNFLYRFFPFLESATPVTSVEFTLLDAAGTTEIKKISRTFTAESPAPSLFPLDFRFHPIPPNPTDDEKLRPKPIANGWYVLNVKINGTDFEQKKILLRADLSSNETVLGVVNISNRATATPFRIIDPTDKSLRLTKVPDSNPVRWRAPVFEVRLMSRLAYWRYSIEKQEGLPDKDIDYTLVSYKKISKQLISRRPLNLTRASVPLPVQDDLFLPNPEKPDIKYDEVKHQYFTELFLSTIKLT